jgi:hypothetical protein
MMPPQIEENYMVHNMKWSSPTPLGALRKNNPHPLSLFLRIRAAAMTDSPI